jgi:hypothetical protein
VIEIDGVALRSADKSGRARVGIRAPDRRQHWVSDLGHFREGLVALEQLRIVRKGRMGEDVVAAEKNECADARPGGRFGEKT